MSPDDPRHGTTRGHAAGCRDLCCRIPRNLDEARRRKYRQVLGITRNLDATGTIRRIQALMVLGHPTRDIAAVCGWTTGEAVGETLKRRWVQRKTAEAIARAYDELSMTVGSSAQTRTRALRKGWAPPLAWDDSTIDDPAASPDFGGQDTDVDPVVVMRLLEGQRIKSTVAEKEAAMARWVADGGSRAELCRWHGWKTGRYGAALRLVQAENDQDLIENEAV